MAKFHTSLSILDFADMNKYGFEQIRLGTSIETFKGPGIIEISPNKATVCATPLLQMVGFNSVPSDKVALRWVTSDFSWSVSTCSLDVIQGFNGKYPKVFMPYSLVP